MTKSYNLKLVLNQKQSLTINEVMQQSLKILQLSSLELNTLLAKELEENPLLEIAFDEEENNYTEKDELEDNIDDNRDLDNKSPDDSDYSPFRVTQTAKYNNDYDLTLEDNPDYDKSLKQYVMEQIYLEIDSEQKRMIALNLTDLLDENGYLDQNYLSLAKSLNCCEEEINNVLKLLHKLEPAGIFARNLGECLLLQLEDQEGEQSEEIKLFFDHLDLLAKRDLVKLKKICCLNDSELDELIHKIKLFDPKPGSKFGNDFLEVIQADIFLKKDIQGNWSLELNNDLLPKLLINRKYYAEIKQKARHSDDRKFLSEQYNLANKLLNALDQRANTILKVATEIVANQLEFFEKGIYHLKPMTLEEIAEKIGMHVSTISRVTSNKYISTPLGLFELKYFFSTKIKNENNDDKEQSNTVIKQMIKDIIKLEPKEKPYSDEDICSMIKEKGINLVRRTITKYRKEMSIPPSNLRKRV